MDSITGTNWLIISLSLMNPSMNSMINPIPTIWVLYSFVILFSSYSHSKNISMPSDMKTTSHVQGCCGRGPGFGGTFDGSTFGMSPWRGTFIGGSFNGSSSVMAGRGVWYAKALSVLIALHHEHQCCWLGHESEHEVEQHHDICSCYNCIDVCSWRICWSRSGQIMAKCKDESSEGICERADVGVNSRFRTEDQRICEIIIRKIVVVRVSKLSVK